MVIRLRKAMIEDRSETETKRLLLLQIVSKSEGAFISLELPEVLCETLNPKEQIGVIIDNNPIPKGPNARFYAEGKVFRVNNRDRYEVMGTIGGLRFTLSLTKPTPSQKKTFENEAFYIALV